MGPSNEIIEEFKAVIIGTGQAGKPLATALANAGWKRRLLRADTSAGRA